MKKGLLSLLFALVGVFIAISVFAEVKQEQMKSNKTTKSVTERRAKILRGVGQLITLSQKESSNLRREIKNSKKRKNNSAKDIDIKAAQDFADKLDAFALQLIEQKRLLTNSNRNFEQELKKTLYIIEKAKDDHANIMFEIQMKVRDAENYTFSASRLSKKEHSIYMKIIDNMKK
ncbi:MAG: hypothetical protein GY697_16370 [Desulfobacterales bacterium]|nr:hypothetical protein [Desulfobacterales bacterium]